MGFLQFLYKYGIPQIFNPSDHRNIDSMSIDESLPILEPKKVAFSPAFASCMDTQGQ